MNGSKGGSRGDDTGVLLTPTPAPDSDPVRLRYRDHYLVRFPCPDPTPSPGRGGGRRRRLVQPEPERFERRWGFGQHHFADDKNGAVDRLLRNNDFFIDSINFL